MSYLISKGVSLSLPLSLSLFLFLSHFRDFTPLIKRLIPFDFGLSEAHWKSGAWCNFVFLFFLFFLFIFFVFFFERPLSSKIEFVMDLSVIESLHLYCMIFVQRNPFRKNCIEILFF